MGSHLVWFATILSVGLLAAAAFRVTAVLARRDLGPMTVPAIGLGLAAAYVGFGLLWAVEDVARLDSEIIRSLEADRKEVAASIFAIFTTFGDAIPMMTIAAGIAVVLHQRTGAWQVWLLPAVIMVEQILQVGTFTVLPTLGIEDVAAELVNGTGGSFPSGSVARMLALFGTAALLCDSLRIRGGWTFRAVGAVLIIEQAVSRLYLGRHLVVDVVGGLLLGLIVVAGVALLLRFLPPRTRAEAPTATHAIGSGPR